MMALRKISGMAGRPRWAALGAAVAFVAVVGGVAPEGWGPELEVGVAYAKKKKATKKKPPKEEPPAEPAPAPPPSDSGMDFGGDGGGGMDFGGTPPVAPPPSQPSTPMSFGDEGGVVVTTSPEDQKRMDLAVDLLKKNNPLPAANAFFEILNNPAAAGLHQAAEYNLAKALYKAQFIHAALYYFREVVRKGPNHLSYQPAMASLLLLARRVKNGQNILEEVGQFEGVMFPEKHRAELSVLLAKYFVLVDDDPKAEGLLNDIPEASESFPESQFLRGVLKFKAGQFQEAVDQLKEVVKMTHPEKGKYDLPRLREQAFMTLARIHFAHKQYSAALFYYERISQDSVEWLDSLFESSYSYFQVGRYAKALGNMITLKAPMFAEQLNPEIDILKAVIYYENCRYAAAEGMANEFTNTFNPVHDKLQSFLQQNATPEAMFKVLMDIRTNKGPKDPVLANILGLAFADQDIRRLAGAIEDMNAEGAALGKTPEFFRASKLAVRIKEIFAAETDKIRKDAGSLAQRQLQEQMKNVKELLTQALRIRLETTAAKKEAEQMRLSGSATGGGLKENPYSPAVADHQWYWTFDGEYWRDELGTYEYHLAYVCR